MTKTSTTKSKIYNLSELNNSILNSNLVLLSGRPGVGKTTFALNYSDYISKLIDKKVLYFSLEMNINKLEECKKNYVELESNGGSKLELCGDISSLESIINKINTENELGLIVIDYIQLLGSVAENKEIKKENIEWTINKLKDISNDLKLPMILISWISKPSNIDNIPSPKNLRLIEYKNFDLILMIYENEKNIAIYDNDQIIGEINLK